MTTDRNWRVWLIYDQRDDSVFAIGASPAGVAQPMPDCVSEKLKATGRHAVGWRSALG
jgi:hypothetical protein